MIPQEREGLDWRARRGGVWADLQTLLDNLLLPFEGILTDASITSGVRDVLDVVCGTGASTLAFAAKLASHGSCTGVDISGPMLDVARSRAAVAGVGNAYFIEGAAQRFDFHRDMFDAVIFRFGIMFFDDPEQAFANIKRAVRPNGALTCVVWRSGTDNPFMIAGEQATAPLMRWFDRPDPNAPGQFAFADAARVKRILRTAGWDAVEITPIDVPCSLPRADLTIYARRMGRVGMMLPDLDQALRERVERELDDAFAPFITNNFAHFDAACWLVRAQAA